MTGFWRITLILAATGIWFRPAVAEDREVAREIYATIKNLDEKKDAEIILSHLVQVLHYDPGFYRAALDAARIYLKEGRNDPAATMYKKVREILSAREKLTEAEKQALQEARGQLAGLTVQASELDAVRKKYAEDLLREAALREKDGKPFSALRYLMILRELSPKNAKGLAAKERLAQQLGPVLTEAALESSWESLFDDFSGWVVRTGLWWPDYMGMRIIATGEAYAFHQGRPRRNFLLRGDVLLQPNSSVFLLGRTQWNGAGYGLGLRLVRDLVLDPKTKSKTLRNEKAVIAYRFDNWEKRRVLKRESTPKNITLSPDNWYQLELEFRGATLICRVNRRVVFRCTDATYQEGGVGVLVLKSGEPQEGEMPPLVRIRHIRVLDLP